MIVDIIIKKHEVLEFYDDYVIQKRGVLSRKEGDIGAMQIDKFVEKIREEMKEQEKQDKPKEKDNKQEKEKKEKEEDNTNKRKKKNQEEKGVGADAPACQETGK